MKVDEWPAGACASEDSGRPQEQVRPQASAGAGKVPRQRMCPQEGVCPRGGYPQRPPMRPQGTLPATAGRGRPRLRGVGSRRSIGAAPSGMVAGCRGCGGAWELCEQPGCGRRYMGAVVREGVVSAGRWSGWDGLGAWG
ncbi:hypothetical protein GCM10010345_15980 [Streptomyces canarius]|uniref:Uncharacterized protein n=1 Tax=Streptomyces canarius TaxID=285453 RepID=A0ABQ3CK48_9ACTN|nr:hypothetical protein GCM10010345_15980 [Streptomyces canarius]